MYRIAQLCDGGKYWRIWQIDCHSPIFYLPVFSYQLGIFTLKSKLPNFSPPISGDKPIHQYFPPPHNCTIRYHRNLQKFPFLTYVSTSAHAIRACTVERVRNSLVQTRLTNLINQEAKTNSIVCVASLDSNFPLSLHFCSRSLLTQARVVPIIKSVVRLFKKFVINGILGLQHQQQII